MEDQKENAFATACRAATMPLRSAPLAALWEHSSEYLARSDRKDPVVNAETRYQGLISRLSGGVAPQPTTHSTADRQKIATIKSVLLQVTSLAPHARGYAVEGFLKDLFNGFGLAAQEPFRLRGEQIDGSFLLGGAPITRTGLNQKFRETGALLISA